MWPVSRGLEAAVMANSYSMAFSHYDGDRGAARTTPLFPRPVMVEAETKVCCFQLQLTAKRIHQPRNDSVTTKIAELSV